MKRFRFPLAKVLRLKERKEQYARRLLGEVLSRLRGIEERRKSVLHAIAYAEEEAAGLGRAAGLAHAYKRSLLWQSKKLEPEYAKTSAELTEVRAFWLKARTEMQSLEKLRDLRRDEYVEEMRRQEQAELEELASLVDRSRVGEVVTGTV